MRITGRIRLYIPSALLLILFAAMPALVLAPSPARAQCQGLCGDYNCSGTLTSPDVLEITRWLYQLVPPCLLEECRDVDGDGVITDRDVVWVTREAFNSVGLHCDSVAPPFSLAPTDDFFLLHENVFPAGDSIVPIHIDIVNSRPIGGFSLTFSILVGGVPAAFEGQGGSLHPYPPGFIGKGETHWDISVLSPSPGLFGFATGQPTLPPARRPALSELLIHMPAELFDRPIKVELFNMDSLLPEIGVYRNSMVVDSDYNALELTVGAPSCPYRQTGDVNMSGDLTSADIISLVNYVFKGGAAPMPCVPAGDANCDLAVNSSDVIQLVNFVFKSGPALCDPCTAYAYPWGCW